MLLVLSKCAACLRVFSMADPHGLLKENWTHTDKDWCFIHLTCHTNKWFFVHSVSILIRVSHQPHSTSKALKAHPVLNPSTCICCTDNQMRPDNTCDLHVFCHPPDLSHTLELPALPHSCSHFKIRKESPRLGFQLVSYAGLFFPFFASFVIKWKSSTCE